jgi:rhamnosyltransferase
MREARNLPAGTPAVTVLLATHNGLRFLPEQVESILAQEGVDVSLVALDDGSTDGTADWLLELAASDSRVTVLHDDGTGGSSAKNFARLIQRVEVPEDALVAFADQDDVWLPGKLARHAALIAEGLDGVSSSVTSFTPDGDRSLVRKDYPQREFDYLLESPGPGCTFLITPRLLRLTAEVLRDSADARAVDFHDSLIYAVARGRGWRWRIDGWPSVDYRQHGANVMGSNVGFAAARERLRLIREHWLRMHSTHLTRVALHVAPEAARGELARILALLTTPGVRSRLALARESSRLRRRPRDQRIIGLLITIGIW